MLGVPLGSADFVRHGINERVAKLGKLFEILPDIPFISSVSGSRDIQFLSGASRSEERRVGKECSS